MPTHPQLLATEKLLFIGWAASRPGDSRKSPIVGAFATTQDRDLEPPPPTLDYSHHYARRRRRGSGRVVRWADD